MSNHHSRTSARPAPKRRYLAVIALTMATALTAAACSSSEGSTDAAKGPVTLTFWVKTPFPDSDVLLDLWNKQHPDIKIKMDIVAASGNTIPQAKLLLDVKAGKEPDVAAFDTQYLPQFVTTGSVLDLNTVEGGNASALSSNFESWAWSTVHVGDGLYGLPIDSGPLSLYYRKDIFDKYGLKVPKTMAEYVQVAKSLHKKAPDVYLADFPTNDASVFNAMAWANGAKPFKVKGDTWVVDIAGKESLKVTDTLQELIDDKVIMTLPHFSSEWSEAYNTGKLASWMSAAWAPGPLKSFAPKTEGKWNVAPMPQWTPGVESSGSWGGSSAVVFKKTKHPKEALEFLKFITTNQQAWSDYWIPKITIYPTNLKAQKSEAFSKPDSFFGGQKIYETIAASNHNVARDYNYGPVANEWFTTQQDYLSKAVNGEMTLAEALKATQKSVVAYMRKQGMNVTEAS